MAKSRQGAIGLHIRNIRCFLVVLHDVNLNLVLSFMVCPNVPIDGLLGGLYV